MSEHRRRIVGATLHNERYFWVTLECGHRYMHWSDLSLHLNSPQACVDCELAAIIIEEAQKQLGGGGV